MRKVCGFSSVRNRGAESTPIEPQTYLLQERESRRRDEAAWILRGNSLSRAGDTLSTSQWQDGKAAAGCSLGVRRSELKSRKLYVRVEALKADAPRPPLML